MNEKATICEINEDKIRVMFSGDCGESCHHCSQSNHKQSILVSNTSGLNIKIGDHVEIFASQGRTILAAFLIFIVPLLLFIPFYFIGRSITGTNNELIPFLCGILGIGVGFLINVAIKKIRKNRDLPDIVRVYPD
ncbi:MAG: SoxR reducing system RseC family protein [Spirochaetales bacterium]|nr:SoxR reducing system RseC family protein [Spirochaetales bacterium]